ncbi:hypothetical protein Anas_02753, partial [Armadillidium nasatum]
LQITYQSVVPEGAPPGLQKTKSLPAGPRTLRLDDLTPRTSYEVCVQGLTMPLEPASRARPHTDQATEFEVKDEDTKCTEVQTLDQPKLESMLNSRFAVILGVCLALILVAIVVIVSICCHICGRKPEEGKNPEPNACTGQDYLSYRPFTQPNNEVTQNHEGYTQ